MKKALIIGTLTLGGGLAVAGTLLLNPAVFGTGSVKITSLTAENLAALVQPKLAAAAEDSVAMTLSRLVISKQTYNDMVTAISKGMVQGAEASGQKVPEGFTTKMVAVIREALPYEEMLAINAKLYSARFSDPELNDVIAFYKTPTGSKLIRELPGLMGDSGKVVGELLPKRLPALMKKHGLTP